MGLLVFRVGADGSWAKRKSTGTGTVNQTHTA